MAQSRRSLLAAVGAALSTAVAGCPGDADTTPEQSPDPSSGTGEQTARPPGRTAAAASTPTPTPGPVVLDPGETHATADGWSLTVAAVAVRIGVVERGTTHPDPRWGEGSQFVTATIRASGDGAPDPAELRFACRTDTATQPRAIPVVPESDDGGPGARVAFEVPADPAPSAGALVWSPAGGPEVRWTLAAEHLDAVARPPAFDLESFRVADAPGEAVAATLTVANRGDGDGVFLAEVGDAALSDQGELRVAVPAGDRRTVTRRIPAGVADGSRTYVLRWRETVIERTVRERGRTATATETAAGGTATAGPAERTATTATPDS